jgi:phosphoribosylformimino-5-aminoimidazole carboxamide ribotide isomerase
VRTLEDVSQLRDAGVDRLVVGTVLARSPEVVGEMHKRAPGAIVAGIDADEGRVKVAGWIEGHGTDLDLAATARDLGLVGAVYTSIRRDGTLAGPDLERTNAVAAAGLRVILSGGIGSARHVEDVGRGRHRGVVGVIVGKALYEGRVLLEDLVRRHQAAADASAW